MEVLKTFCRLFKKGLMVKENRTGRKNKFYKGNTRNFTEIREKKEKLHSWNKSSKFSNLSNFNNKVVGEEEEIKKDWKNDTTNNSTHSLRIASIDILSDQLSDLKKFGSTKKQIITVDAVKFDIQNPFEFPRQQESEEMPEPEVSQFRATQRLINPNEALLDENNNAILLQTAISQSSSYEGDITDFEENRIIESIVRLRDILSDESDEDYTQTDYSTSEYSLLTPSDGLVSTVDEDIPRAEVVAATLDQIQQLLEEAQANNDMIEAEAAWANLDNVEPGSLFTRACRALIRLPFIFLRAAVMGIWELNMMIFKIPLHLFYFIQGTFYGIATIFAGSSSPARQIEENEQLELISQSTQNDDDSNIVDEEGQQQRQTCESEEITFEENIEFDRCSTELNGISEYNESLGGCIDHESSEYEGEEFGKGYIRLSEAQALQNSSSPSRYFSTYAPSNLSDVETFRTFFEPPSQILIASERDESLDTRAPMPLYDLHRRQGNCDNQEF
uniref:Uncharacterized protein n=1 Tax=Panagrolaimus sp. PS1159 TaxID=55785 RepID=A0AC35F3Z4_9BILA